MTKVYIIILKGQRLLVNILDTKTAKYLRFIN